MTASPEKSRIAAEKRTYAKTRLERGVAQAQINRELKKKYGSGLNSMALIRIAKAVRTKRGPEAVIDWSKLPLPSAAPKAKETAMRRFVLDRSFDATGTSGTGIVAEGVQFSSGHVVIHWLSQLEAINVYGNAMVLEQLHGHNGNTIIKWLDP